MSVWRGNNKIQLIDDDWDSTPDKTTVVLTYTGPRADCRSSQPSLFQSVAGFPGLITSVKVPGGQSPDGRLIIICDSLNNTIYEVDWAACFKKLLTHPIFQPGGSYALTDDDLNQINLWINSSQPSLRASTYAGMSANAQYYINKIKLGEEEYPVAYPVAKMTTKTPTQPEGVGEGMYTKESPPDECGAPIGTWVYYKSADSCLFEARFYARRQEWTGAQYLDPDIFNSSDGAKKLRVKSKELKNRPLKKTRVLKS